MNIDLNPAKNWFANNRSVVASAIQYANLANTAAYLTSALSEETYATILLSGMVGSTLFELIDASVCYAAKDVPSISERDAEQKAKLRVEALKAEAAFREHEDLDHFLRWQFGFPVRENLQSMSKWEIAKGCASFLANSTAPFYVRIQEGVHFRACEWSFIIPFFSVTIVKEALKNFVATEEISQDVETLNRWLSTMQEPPEDPGHPVYKEIEEQFASTLNRATAYNPQTGVHFAEAFQTLAQAHNKSG